MKVLFISHTAGRAGAETVLIDTIRSISLNTNFEVFIALPNDGDNAFVNKLGQDIVSRCKIERVAIRPVRNTLLFLARNICYSYLFGFMKLKRIIKSNNIDVVFVNSSVNIMGVIAARATDRPYIWHIHEQSTSKHRWAPKWFKHFYNKWLRSNKCQSIFVSKLCYTLWCEDLAKTNIENSQILYSRYNTIAATKKNNDKFTFGFIGSLTKNKNIGQVIDAFENLGDDCRLLIAGGGIEESFLKEKAIKHNNIVFLGHVNDVQNSFYSEIDCLILPSLNESWGLVVLEAISANIPTIITQNTGLTELLEDKVDCLFINPSDVSSIINAMNLMKNDELLRLSIIERAACKLDKLNINNEFLQRIITLINESKI